MPLMAIKRICGCSGLQWVGTWIGRGRALLVRRPIYKSTFFATNQTLSMDHPKPTAHPPPPSRSLFGSRQHYSQRGMGRRRRRTDTPVSKWAVMLILTVGTHLLPPAFPCGYGICVTRRTTCTAGHFSTLFLATAISFSSLYPKGHRNGEERRRRENAAPLSLTDRVSSPPRPQQTMERGGRPSVKFPLPLNHFSSSSPKSCTMEGREGRREGRKTSQLRKSFFSPLPLSLDPKPTDDANPHFPVLSPSLLPFPSPPNEEEHKQAWMDEGEKPFFLFFGEKEERRGFQAG